MPFKPKNPETIERAIAGLCYLSGGLIGLLYIIISRSKSQSMFFRFHFLQSMILVVLGFLLGWTEGIMMQILGGLAQAFNATQAVGQGLEIFAFVVEWIMKGGFL